MPRWKESILTWIGVNFTGFTLAFTLNPANSGWRWFAGFLAFDSAMVAGLTWLVMPASIWLARGWSYPPRRDDVDEYCGTHSSQRPNHHE
jgi:antibiotic biosynthesis monooxygenase (ABM) superfamily enzyme